MRETVAGLQFETQETALPDGRSLAYAVIGDGPTPLLYFHGATTCRYEGLSVGGRAARLGLRIVAPDRPGYGRSTFNPRHSQRSWADDVRRLADALRIDRFAVMGVSAGGAHAVAAAAFLPDRVSRCLLINTAGDRFHPAWRAVPLRTRLLLTLLMTPGVARRIAFEPVRRDPARALGRRPGVDRPAIAANLAWLVPAFQEGLRQGVAAAEQDTHLLYDAAWEAAIDSPPQGVDVFQGEADMLTPFVREAARRNPSLRLTEIPGGHLGGWTDPVWEAVAAKAAEGMAGSAPDEPRPAEPRSGG